MTDVGPETMPSLDGGLLVAAVPRVRLRPGRRGRRPGRTRLTIGAYSVVREAFHDGLLPAFASALEGEDRARRSGSRSRTTARARRAGRSPRGSTPISRSSRSKGTSTGWSRRGSSRRTGTPGRTRGSITQQPRRHRRPGGQPQRDPGLGRPGPGRTWTCFTPTPRPPAGPAGTSTRFTARGCSTTSQGGQARPEGGPRPAGEGPGAVVNMDASGRQSMATFERGTGDAVGHV